MTRPALYWIDPSSSPDSFPPVDSALVQPDGLLCFGGDLSNERLLSAYRLGIFPWYSENQPIMWWSPNPRCVLFPEELKVSRSLRKTLRNAGFEYSINQAFDKVVSACAQPRSDDTGTWITAEMRTAYSDLHRQGHAHSVEIWKNNELAGGLYGIAIGKVFFGESMFSFQRDASKVALCCLTQELANNDFKLIDCQVSSSHLFTLGARDIDRNQFSALLNQYCDEANTMDIWQHEPVLTREQCISSE